MAVTTKVYTSKYSGDQLDAAIAALGSLESMFASKADFEKFQKAFTEKMDEFIDKANEASNTTEASVSVVKKTAAEAVAAMETEKQEAVAAMEAKKQEAINKTDEAIKQAQLQGLVIVALDKNGEEVETIK